MRCGRVMVGVMGAVVLAAAVGVSAAGTQRAKFDEVFSYVTKCSPDGLKQILTNDPTGATVMLKDANGVPLIVAAAATDCSEAVKVLYTQGADMSDTDKQGRTALHAAAASSTLTMVQYLVDKKADINAKTDSGDTPLSLAKTNNYKGKTDEQKKIVDYLTKKGAKDK